MIFSAPYSDGAPVIHVQLNGHVVEGLLATGSAVSHVTPDLANQIGLISAGDCLVTITDGNVTVSRKVFFEISPIVTGRSIILGINFLKHFGIVIFDGPNQTVTLMETNDDS